MNSGLVDDPETNLTQIVYVIVYTTHKKRGRFPENCVEICLNEASAIENAEPANHRFAARLHGPCRSSEGFKLYYLIEWLNPPL